MRVELSRHIFEMSSNIEFHAKMRYGRTDKQTGQIWSSDSHFSRFCESS